MQNLENLYIVLQKDKNKPGIQEFAQEVYNFNSYFWLNRLNIYIYIYIYISKSAKSSIETFKSLTFVA